ncbi:hypothetical protein [Kitasatospora sp. A2-31]|uniref:hypothetical protein n=1 Tax=Kitasatospora sp. A2-31 TaxID=2916414 RepID=UPI001EECE373|nr:hypothetical protein [Kitasatospora sp. A2-31]MCG6496625.1 hypothetical protein [Kitasatospora sp. A2-31]
MTPERAAAPPSSGAVVDLWRALTAGHWRRDMPPALRLGRARLALHALADLADASGWIPAEDDVGDDLAVRVARRCALRPEAAARLLAAFTAAGVLVHRGGGIALTTAVAPDWTAALAALDTVPVPRSAP